MMYEYCIKLGRLMANNSKDLGHGIDLQEKGFRFICAVSIISVLMISLLLTIGFIWVWLGSQSGLPGTLSSPVEFRNNAQFQLKAKYFSKLKGAKIALIGDSFMFGKSMSGKIGLAVKK